VANTFPLPKALAFTTIPGGDLADIILLGSEAADTVVLNTSQTIVANGFGGDDSITVANPIVATGGNTSTFTAPSTIYGGEGNDSLLLSNLIVGSSAILGGAGNDFFGTGTGANDYQAAEANGNEGEDTFGSSTRGIQAVGSQILGGSNNDTIWIGTSTSTEFNGNKNLDRLTVVAGSTITGGSIFGGKGIDFLTLGASTFNGTSVSGADGNDVITATGSTVAASSTLTILGGEGVDNISVQLDGAATAAALVGGGTEGDFITASSAGTLTKLTIQGGEGADTITGYGSINGGAGADSITLNGNTTLLYAMSSIATETGISTSTIDSIVGFTSATDAFKTGVAGKASNFEDNSATTVGSFAAALNAANLFFLANEDVQYYTITDSSVADSGGYIFFKDTTTATNATAAVQVNNVDEVVFADFIA
jgi:hypothetical protein